jgi:hypothetical protein
MECGDRKMRSCGLAESSKSFGFPSPRWEKLGEGLVSLASFHPYPASPIEGEVFESQR